MGSDTLDQLLNTAECFVGNAKNYPKLAFEYFEHALLSTNQALRHSPDHPRALFHKINILFDMRNYESALDTTNHYLTLPGLTPEQHFIALTDKGYALLELKHPAEALDSYQQAHALLPSHNHQPLARLSVSMARCYMGLLDSADSARQRDEFVAEAMRYFSQAVKLEPQDSKIREYKGEAHLSLKQPGQAIADFTDAIEHDHENPVLYLRLADAYALSLNLPPVVNDPRKRKQYRLYAEQNYKHAKEILSKADVSKSHPEYHGVEQRVVIGLRELFKFSRSSSK